MDAGYHFKDFNNNYSYRGKGVYIPTVKEVFEAFGDMPMIIEIKDDNPPGRIREVAEKLWGLIEGHQLEGKVIVASFDHDIINTFGSFSKGQTPVAAGKQEVIKFVTLHKLFLVKIYFPKADFLHIPTSKNNVDLKNEVIINGAKMHNIDIHYWTIDDKKMMRQLIEAGADGIMTSRLDLMVDLLKEMGYRK